MGLNVPAIFPSSSTVNSVPPSLHRVPWGEFPCFTGNMRYSDSLSPIPPRSVAFAQQYQLVETRGPPRFPGGPHCIHALLSDPGGISTSGHGRMASPDSDYERFVARDYRGPCLLHCSPTPLQRVDTAFRTSPKRRLPQLTYFGAQSHGLHTRCLRFATRVTPMPRKTRFRLVASLYRTGFITRWVPLQGFSNASSLLPPCPSFPGARGLK